jgi:amidase
VPLAIGTETDGSIVCPAGANGIVGVKPTLGLVSQDGIVPLSWTQDTAGPMTRSVLDAALALTVIAGPHPERGRLDYTAGLSGDAARGRRVGVWRGYFGADDTPRVTRILEAALAALETAGAVVIDPVEIELPPDYREAEWTVLRHEFKIGLNRYLEGRTPGSLRAVIEFNERSPDPTLRWFGQDLLVAAQGGGAGDTAYESALRRGRALAATVTSIFTEHQLDALIAPTNSPAWPIDFVAGDRLTLESSSLAAISGRPSLTLPAGVVHGLPVGVSLTGVAWRDADLLAIAYALEQQLPAPKRPQFLPTLEVGAAERP